jgi:chromate reductase
MKTINIAVIVGSLRRDSLNRKLTGALAKLAPPDFKFRQVKIDDLPLYNQDDDDHQLTQVLKNVVTHASRPYGQSVWGGKPAGVLGASVGAVGTAMAQQHLRNILAYLNMPTLGQPEALIHAKEGFFDAQGFIDPPGLSFVQGWMDHYVTWVREYVVSTNN